MNKKNKWRLRRFMRYFYRNFKGLPDILGIALFCVGVIVFISGITLLMIADASCVMVLFTGFACIYVGYDILKRERRNYG